MPPPTLATAVPVISAKTAVEYLRTLVSDPALHGGPRRWCFLVFAGLTILGITGFGPGGPGHFHSSTWRP